MCIVSAVMAGAMFFYALTHARFACHVFRQIQNCNALVFYRNLPFAVIHVRSLCINVTFYNNKDAYSNILPNFAPNYLYLLTS